MSFQVPFSSKVSTKGSDEVAPSTATDGAAGNNKKQNGDGVAHWRSDAPSQRVVVTCDFSVPKTFENTDPETGETTKVTKHYPRNVDVHKVIIRAPVCTHIELRGKSGIDGKEVVLCPKKQLTSMFEHKQYMHQKSSSSGGLGGGAAAGATKSGKTEEDLLVVTLDAQKTVGGAMTEVSILLLTMWEPLDRVSFLSGGIEVKGAYCKDPASCALKVATPTTIMAPAPPPPSFVPSPAKAAAAACETTHKPKKTPAPLVPPGAAATTAILSKMTGKKRDAPDAGGDDDTTKITYSAADEIFPVTFGAGASRGDADDDPPTPEDKEEVGMVFPTPAVTHKVPTPAGPPPPPKATATPHAVNTILKGCVVVLSGYQNPLRAEIRDKAISLGAKVQNDWSGSCTHLICVSPSTPKYIEVSKAGNGLIVGKDWVLDGWNKKSRQDETYYIVGSGGMGGPPTKKFKGGGGTPAGGSVL